MPVIWGIHNDQSSLDLVDGGFISIGWEELGDLTTMPTDRESLKLALAATYPTAKPGAIPVWAGVLVRFIDEMKVGDYVISPTWADRTLNFGAVGSELYVEPGTDLTPNRRKVRWLHTGVPRDQFSKSALHELGSAITLFRVKTHAAELPQFLSPGRPPGRRPLRSSTRDATRSNSPRTNPMPSGSRPTAGTSWSTSSAGWTRTASSTSWPDSSALGYRATATVASGDGGVDVIASRDPLALEPPIIKVQCKRTINTTGAPDVQKLAGALAHGGAELGLFVTLGSYSMDALHIERTRQDLRPVNGNQLVDLIFEHYDALDRDGSASYRSAACSPSTVIAAAPDRLTPWAHLTVARRPATGRCDGPAGARWRRATACGGLDDDGATEGRERGGGSHAPREPVRITGMIAVASAWLRRVPRGRSARTGPPP